MRSLVSVMPSANRASTRPSRARYSGLQRLLRSATIGAFVSLAWLPIAAHASASDALAQTADPGDPAQVCAGVGTNDSLMPLPLSWAPAARQALGLAMPDAMMAKTTYARCMNGTAMVCNAGANLPCGKADTRTRRKEISGYCSEHPGADMIPAYVTGHDTPYVWTCNGTRAVPNTANAEKLDARGFFTRYWRPLPSSVPKRSD